MIVYGEYITVYCMLNYSSPLSSITDHHSPSRLNQAPIKHSIVRNGQGENLGGDSAFLYCAWFNPWRILRFLTSKGDHASAKNSQNTQVKLAPKLETCFFFCKGCWFNVVTPCQSNMKSQSADIQERNHFWERFHFSGFMIYPLHPPTDSKAFCCNKLQISVDRPTKLRTLPRLVFLIKITMVISTSRWMTQNDAMFFTTVQDWIWRKFRGE